MTLTPYLAVADARAAIAFYVDGLGGTPVGEPIVMDDGRVGHAEVDLGGSRLMLADEFPEMDVRGPRSIGGTPVTIHVYVEDADAVFDAAVQAGATAVRAVEDQFYGDRSGQFEDPWGQRWNVATHVEDVPPDEMEKRMAETMAG